MKSTHFNSNYHEKSEREGINMCNEPGTQSRCIKNLHKIMKAFVYVGNVETWNVQRGKQLKSLLYHEICAVLNQLEFISKLPNKVARCVTLGNGELWNVIFLKWNI